uniref:Reverse transcriptase Ty1/copia-type domain-containing protein n=1 Tax=Tanacetum cinerariifolium TaxID=118510 RepID=A0A6L2LG85_TANCI|nr:hypothetical protein [Tanacetum cinerariifolium]
MESLSPQVVSAAKLPILNPNEFDLWKIRIEQYFLMTDYSLLEFILNGDSPAPTRVIVGVLQPVAPTTAEQMLARKNELKARGTLLKALPDKYQLKFNTHKDAKTLMEAIEKSINEPVSAAASVSAVSAKIHVSSLPNVDSLSNDVIYSIFASQSNSPQSDNDDLKQIDTDDIKEMDLKWQMAMWSVTTTIRRDTLQGSVGVFKQKRSLPTMLLWLSHLQVLLLTMRYQSGNGYHDVPPPYSGTFMPSKPNLVFNNAPNDVESVHTAFNVKLSPTKPDQDLSHTNKPLAPIIEDRISDSEDESEIKTPQNVLSFVLPSEQVKFFRHSVQPVETSIPTVTSKTAIPKPTSNGKHRNRKACFVCKSLDKLIKDYDYHDQKMAQISPRNHGQRGNHKHCARMPFSSPQRHVVPTVVVPKSKLIPINAARPITVDVPKIKVTRPRPRKHVVTKPTSPLRKHINRGPSPKASNSPPRVTAVMAPMVNAAKGNPQYALKDKGVINSGCLRHMTGNMSYLSNFKEINGGYVTFGGNPKGGKISGKDSLGKFNGKVDEGFLVGYYNTDGDAAFDEKEPEFDEKKPESKVNVSPSSSTQLKNHDDKTKSEAKVLAVGQISPNSTNTFSTAGPSNAAANPTQRKSSCIDTFQLHDDPDMLELEDITYSDDEDDVGAEADFNNLVTSITISPIPTTRVHKDHPMTQIIGDLSLATQTRSMTRVARDQGGLSQINNDDFYTCFMVYKIDVKSAFLYETIEEEVYVCQPPGFEDPVYPDKVYKVVKALYGLHQAPRAWQKDDILLVQIYVDDIIFGSTNKDLCKAFEKLMKDKFKMSSMEELTFFLGLQVKQKKDGIFITQDKYLAEIFRKFRLTDGKSARTPIDTKKPLLKDPNGEDVDVHTYRSMIGSLMYLTSSRLEIMFAICTCARFQVTPKASHLHAVKRIFRYLKGKPHLGLWYPKDSPFDLVAYSDSDYAGASLDRKPTTGGCQFLLLCTSAMDSESTAGLWGVECLPNEEIFKELARMSYEKPSTKLTFYKAFFSSQWKFLNHTILQCMSAKRTSWNEFCSSMASAVICLSSGRKFNFSKKQVGDLSSHSTKYTSPTLTQKVFANMRRVGKGFFGVETPLFKGMLVAQEVGEDDDEVHVEDVNVVGVATEGVVSAADDVVPADKIAQALEKTKLKSRVKKLERRNKASKLKRLKKVGSAQTIDTSDDTIMDDGRTVESQAQIYQTDLELANKVLSIQDEEESEPSEFQEVVDVVTTAKIITKVVTAASDTITAASTTITGVDVPILTATTITAPTLTATPGRRRKGVVIRGPQETASPSTIIHFKAKSKDKGKEILVEEPKPLKKKAQIKQDEKYAREDLEALWSLVKERFATTKPKNFSDDFLLITLGAMFEKPDIHAQIWKNKRSVHGQAKVKSWKLLESCGEHAKCLILLVKELVLPSQVDAVD